jgi:pSer/pThr/pTyr-binding forkhead associated (FHA) protein
MDAAATGSDYEWVLRSTDGLERRLRFETHEARSVGRDLGSDVLIQDAGVSRHHAVFTLEEGELWVEDLHSQNGTFVNTRRVHRVRLKAGDIVTFGRTHLILLGSKQTDAKSKFQEDQLVKLLPEQLTTLLRLSRRLLSRRESTLALQDALESARKELKCERAALLYWDRESRRVEPFRVGTRGESLTTTTETVRGIAEAALLSGRAHSHPGGAPPTYTPDCWHADANSTVRVEGAGWSRTTPSIAVAPLYANGEPLAVFCVERSRPDLAFDASELRFLSALAWVSEVVAGAAHPVAAARVEPGLGGGRAPAHALTPDPTPDFRGLETRPQPESQPSQSATNAQRDASVGRTHDRPAVG